MITVNVALYATLRKYRPDGGKGGSFRIDLPDGAPVAKLLEILRVPRTQTKLVFVNNVDREADYVLQDEQKVAIFPPIAGG